MCLLHHELRKFQPRHFSLYQTDENHVPMHWWYKLDIPIVYIEIYATTFVSQLRNVVNLSSWHSLLISSDFRTLYTSYIMTN